MLCIDISADESLAVSGHWNDIALVWDISTSTWKCRFALEGHSDGVICATISEDSNRIVTVGICGELRLWDTESGAAALCVVVTGMEHFHGSRGAISLDGGHFLWATRDDYDRQWSAKLFDLVSGNVVLNRAFEHCPYGKEGFYNWSTVQLEEITAEAGHGGDGAQWRYGTVFGNRLSELSVADSGQTTNLRRISISSHGMPGQTVPHLKCELHYAEGAVSDGTSLYSIVESFAAAWISGPDSRRCAIVACRLEKRWAPAILHLILAKD